MEMVTVGKAEAVAEIFVTAFRSLSAPEKKTIIEKLLSERYLREDLIDIVTAL